MFSPADVEALFDSLPECDRRAPLDADDSSRVIAAAECVATLMGRLAPDVPEDLSGRLAGKEASPELIEKARHALSAVLAASELIELWAEGDDGGGEWSVAVTGLIDRLNPELPYDPPPRDEMEMRSGCLTPCVFCDEEIAEGEVFNLEFRDYSNADGLWLSRGLYCHLKCLNRKLHPRHLLQNWKFDHDAPPPFRDLLED